MSGPPLGNGGVWRDTGGMNKPLTSKTTVGITAPDGTPRVLLLLPAFSCYPEALDWAREKAEQQFGPVALASERFPFVETTYYHAAMGEDLQKCFLVFERLIDPATLPAIKRMTIAWEEEYRAMTDHPVDRPLNLDPGYITEAKVVLATTKNRDHRIYLSDGIFAEVTLFYRGKRWQSREWTYRNYQRDDYQRFFTECRNYLRRCKREVQGE